MADLDMIPLQHRGLCRQCGAIYDARDKRPQGFPGHYWCRACAYARRRETYAQRRAALLDPNPELVDLLAAAWQPVSCRVFSTTTGQLYDALGGCHTPWEHDPRVCDSIRVAARRIGAQCARKSIAFAVARRHGIQEPTQGRFILDDKEYSARRLEKELIRRALHPN